MNRPCKISYKKRMTRTHTQLVYTNSQITIADFDEKSGISGSKHFFSTVWTELILHCNGIGQLVAPIFLAWCSLSRDYIYIISTSMILTECRCHLSLIRLSIRLSLWSTWKYEKQRKLDARDRKIERSACEMHDVRMHTGCCWSESKVSMGIRVWPLHGADFQGAPSAYACAYMRNGAYVTTESLRV